MKFDGHEGDNGYSKRLVTFIVSLFYCI